MSNSLRVLVIDDNPNDAERMLLELGRCGFELDWRRIETADELRTALAEERWDVLLSEQTLPIFGAAQALALLKETEAEIPFVVLSNRITEEAAVELMRAGASDCILKERPYRLGPAVERGLREAKNQRARHQAEQDAFRLAAIVQCSGDAIISQTLDGVIISWNPAAEKLFGWSAAEAIGRPISFLVPPDRFEEQTASLERVRQGEQVEQWETVRVRKDGTRIDVAITLSPVRDRAGVLVGASKFARDITEKKQLEQQYRQAQKMEAVGQLAGGVAHDFNNLLTIITGYSDLLLQRLPPADPSRELVKVISQACEKSASLTRQLLAFSRKQVVSPKVLDLNALVADAEKMLHRVLGEDMRLETSLKPQLGHIKADPGQIEQVLMNLVINARDAMPQGGRLTIETEDVELGENYTHVHANVVPGLYVRLAVSDTGCGMPPEVKVRIFEPFFTTKESGKGTGLGLSVVHGIVKETGGHIEVYSEPDIGTTFKVYLPRVDRPARSNTSQSAYLPVPCGTETILLVEDEDGVRALTRHILVKCGYRTLEASGGDEALRIVEQHQDTIHLLVTDVVMPGLGGRKLAERVQAIHPEAKVLYLSGYTDDAVVRHGILHEKVQFLQKPFSLQSLAIKVREVLGG